jgi:hypothetical protein
VSAFESITWLEAAIACERAVAASWSLAGWPAEANYYRRNALKAMRILRSVYGAAVRQADERRRESDHQDN